MGQRQRLTTQKTRTGIVALLALAVVAPLTGAEAASPTPVERLRVDVARQLSRSTAGIRAAVVAVSGYGHVVNLRGGDLLPPASTQKLLTAGTVLVSLGPDTRLRTEVRRRGELLPDGTLVGDLALVAGGDPSLAGAGLDHLAAHVAANGIARVTGSLVIDDTRYDRARTPGGWKPHYLPEESGPLSALSVDVNGWRRDGPFLHDPATHNGERFRQALSRVGVVVDGPTVVGGPVAGAVVASLESAPTSELVRHMVKSSDDFQAELLLKEAGHGSTGAGLAVLEELAGRLGAPKGMNADGSGLSQIDRQSALGLVAWLMAMDGTPVAFPFRASLPIHCGDGTLRHRLCATPAAGRVAAKTGSLPGVVTLAGYTTTGTGRQVWFAFLLSGVRSATRARAAVDQAVLVLATSGA